MPSRIVRRPWSRAAALALALSLTAASTARADTPPSFARLVERERPMWLKLRGALPEPESPSQPPYGPPVHPPPLDGHIDLVHQAMDATLDPTTGVASATYVIQFAGMGAATSKVGLVIDPGIDVSSVSSPSSTATFTSQAAGAYRVVEITLGTPLADGEVAEVTVTMGGTLACSDASLCTNSPSFAHYTRASLFPYLYDPTLGQEPVLDLATHEVTLHVPESAHVVMTGELQEETVASGTRTARWAIGAPFSKDLGFYAFVGDIGTLDVPDRPTPTFCVFEPPESDVDVQRRDWSKGALELVESMAGRPLPFDKTLSLVRLPAAYDDPGTATYAMTLLSEVYADAGDLLHEETWAHENAHLFWGILVPELSYFESRLLSEGLATFTEVDYTFPRHFADMDRDAYLAMRYGAVGLDLRLSEEGQKVPPILLSGAEADGSVFDDYDVYVRWAYLATAALLDHLRVTVGDEGFDAGLALYVDACFEVGCGVPDLENAMEQSTGLDLAPFFARWVTARERTPVTVSFVPNGSGADVTLDKPDGEPMTLVLDLTLESGETKHVPAALEGPSTSLALGQAGGVRAVRVNPRHQVFVDARSALASDQDGDGEADGLDVLECARFVGAEFEPGLSLWQLAPPYDPACDRDGNGRVDQADIDIITSGFGTVR